MRLWGSPFTIPGAHPSIRSLRTRKIRPGDEAMAALLLLLLCLPAAANFYIVGSQDVVIVAQLLYLKCMRVLVETSIYVACYSLASAIMCFYCISESLDKQVFG